MLLMPNLHDITFHTLRERENITEFHFNRLKSK